MVRSLADCTHIPRMQLYEICLQSIIFFQFIGERQELERSDSSTNPHTVSLYTGAEEFPASIEIAQSRRGVVADLPMSNSDCHVEISDNVTTLASNSQNRNDVIT